MDDQLAWYYYKKLTPEEAETYKSYLEDQRKQKEKEDQK